MAERLYLRLEEDPVNAPESTVPVGTMRALAVEPALRPFVSQLVAYRERFDVPLNERVIPDGATRLIFHAQGPSGGDLPGLRVAGATVRPVVLDLRGITEGISLTLRPGAIRDLLGVPATALADADVPLEAVWPEHGRRLLDELASARDDRSRATILQTALRARGLSGAGSDARHAKGALSLIAASDGRKRVRELASELGLGERRLQQVFRKQVGLTPRTWSRLVRLHACIRALRGASEPNWSDLALELGFYDQAHLSNEFRALSGLSPRQFFRRARGSGFSKTDSPASSSLRGP
jgi:AraC-like DNA-binding protein